MTECLHIDKVIQRVDAQCRAQKIPMLGMARAAFLMGLVGQKRPLLVVECGTAIGYSGLWLGKILRALGRGRVISHEIDPKRAEIARRNFEEAGVGDLIEIRVGDAHETLKALQEPVEFLFIDNDFKNYWPCFQSVEPRLTDGATILADNAGIGAAEMADYLSHVRHHHESRTIWFDLDLEWSPRDAMELTVYRRRKS